MPHHASTDASPTGGPRSLRCRTTGAGHRAAAGELAALAFHLPAQAGRDRAGAVAPLPVPRPRPAAC